MKQSKVNVKVIPDCRRLKDHKRLPLKLRITHKGTRKYYGTGYDASIEEWEIINSVDAKGRLRRIKNAIAIIENDAQRCCDVIIPFSFKKFEYDFFDQKVMFDNLKSAFDSYIDQLKKNEQFGTAKSYQDSCNALHRFRDRLKFDNITKEFLDEFEKWMINSNKSISTVGIYLRPLRTIINLAKENGTIKLEAYPFGKRKYIIPTGRNIKKALNIEQIKQIFHYPTVLGNGLDKAKDFWIFSYLCNGINMSDIARLRWNNINQKTIVFEREKTKRTKRENPFKIVALRNNHINAIIEKWRNKPTNNLNALVFNIIEEQDHPERVRKKIQQFIHVTNDWMKRLGEELRFDLKLTTYVARHSYATILVRNGAPLALARQTLGHASIATTEKYFAGFDLAAQEEYTKALINF
jgi:integrase/recombinase XerD